MYRKLLLIPVFLSLFADSFAKERFTYITIDDGLSQSSGKAIAQDNYGYMWFGTADGLNRYDGYSITKYYNTPANNLSLPGNDISFLYSNPYDSSLWIGTQNAGPALYVREIDDFRNFRSQLNNLNNGVFGHISDMAAIDKTRLAISTRENGIYIFNSVDSTFTVPEFCSEKPLTQVYAMEQDSKGNLWLGTSMGLYCWTKESIQSGSSPVLAGDIASGTKPAIRAIDIDNKGYLIIGTENRGVLKYHPDSGESIRILNQELESSFASIAVTDVLVRNDGSVWVSTNDGLYRITDSGRDIQLFSSNPLDPESLNDDNISVLFEDRSGIMWIGTFQGGINILDPSRNRFRHYNNFLFTRDKDPMTNNILSICRDNDGAVYVSTNNGVFKIRRDYFAGDKSSDDFISKPFNDIVQYIHNDPVAGVLLSLDGKLHRVKPDGRMISYSDLMQRQLGLNMGTFSSAVTDSDGAVWFAAMSGVCRFDHETEIFRLLQAKDESGNVKPLYILTLNETHDGKLIAGTYYGEVYLIDRHTGNFERILYPGWSSIINSISKIFSVAESEPGILWVGTDNGLYRLDYGKRTIQRFLKEDGLSNNHIYGILVDKTGRIWCSTNYGLSVYYPESGQFQNYSREDGLQSNEFNQGAFYADADGIFYFGGINGINIFNPTEIAINTYIPPVYIESMEIQYQIVSSKTHPEILQSQLSAAKSITLNHRQGTFSFDYSALNFSQSLDNRYMYMLENYDDDWINAGTRRRASYTGVEPGTYTFKVKGSNSDGVWNDNPATILIEIKPPYWKTTWFRVLFLTMLCSGIYLVFYYRISNIKRQKAILERKVLVKTEAISEQKSRIEFQNTELRRINEELNQKNSILSEQNERIRQQRDDMLRLTNDLQEANQARVKFFTTISHEFRTPLTLIINPLRNLIENINEKSRDHVLKQLRTIYNNSSKLLLLVNQILDFRRSEATRWELNLTTFDFVDFVRQIIALFNDVAAERKIRISLESSAGNLKVTADGNKIEKVILNLLSNAFRYTAEGGSIFIMLRKEDDKDSHIVFCIRDTGAGIPPEIMENIFERFHGSNSGKIGLHEGSGLGLSIAKKFIELHGGEISAESVMGEGSTFTFRIPARSHGQDTAEYTEEEALTPSETELTVASLQSYLPLDINRVDTIEDMNKHRVLLVEADPNLSKYLEDVLSANFRIAVADSATAALRLTDTVIPELVICDEMLPDTGGLELCERIKKDFRTNHLPVIILTAIAGRENEISGLKSGADAVLTKPFDMEQMVLKAKNLIDSKIRLQLWAARQAPGLHSDDQEGAGDKSFYSRMVELIDQNISDPSFNVDELCMKLEISHAQAYRKTKALTNLSISEFIRNVRLKKAAAMLLANEYKINEVAYRVGFSDANYFTKCFTRLYGQTPRQYIKSVHG